MIEGTMLESPMVQRLGLIHNLLLGNSNYRELQMVLFPINQIIPEQIWPTPEEEAH